MRGRAEVAARCVVLPTPSELSWRRRATLTAVLYCLAEPEAQGRCTPAEVAACLREMASGRLVLGGVPMRRAAAALHTVQRLHASLLAVSAETELTYTGDTIKL